MGVVANPPQLNRLNKDGNIGLLQATVDYFRLLPSNQPSTTAFFKFASATLTLSHINP